MKHVALYFGVAALMMASCSIQEENFKAPDSDDVVFYATFEQPSDEGTKVYATEDLYVRWNADDRVSIFNKLTYNQEFRFMGQTGANSGEFRKVDGDEFVTGNPITHVVSVYPYQESTEISESEELRFTLPAEQIYAENSFGPGANTMVSVSSDNVLQYKNAGGYLMLKLYGEGVSVSSITLKGKNGERLAGSASITMPLDGIPTTVMDRDATNEITLTCIEPVPLGATAEESTQFWFVVPPVTFSDGFTVTVNDSLGGTFEKSTTKSVTIERNILSKMSPMEVVTVSQVSRYLTFTSEGTTMISLTNYKDNAPVLFYSADKTHWTLWDYSELTFTKDQPLYVCGDNPNGFSFSIDQFSTFVTRGSFFQVSGSIMSLVESDREVDSIPCECCFYRLFAGCTGLTAAPELSATTLADECYYDIFLGCTSLATTPELPATTLAAYCYSEMFWGCTSLTSAPELPATTLAEYCYSGMFIYCTNLTSAPKLPASTLACSCYSAMFFGCTSLTTAPDLPATTLAEYCYQVMFNGCTNLTAAPELPATTLAHACYQLMFWGCTSLTTAPELPATTLADFCYYGMFRDCTSLTTAPELPVTTLADYCYSDMFFGCKSLATAPELPATTLANYCYFEMFGSCTSLTSAPELPATTLACACYHSMFSGCRSLATAPELPATTLVDYCYYGMFRGCSSLTSAPELPATTLAEHCYYNMFMGCTNLNYIKCLAADNGALLCVSNWLSDVASAGVFVKAAGMNDWTRGSSGIPEGWTVVDDTSISVREAVDMGLSVKWASFNLGATAPEECGDYYAWGETEPKDDYSWATYKWGMGIWETMTKYCSDSDYGYNGFTDTKTVLDPEDDAAHVNLGSGWRMPTDEEWTELRENCSWTWTSPDGVNGYFITAGNGNSIFLPAAGRWAYTSLNFVGSYGNYLSSSLCTDFPGSAWAVSFTSSAVNRNNGGTRCYGYSVRPVSE